MLQLQGRCFHRVTPTGYYRQAKKLLRRRRDHIHATLLGTIWKSPSSFVPCIVAHSFKPSVRSRCSVWSIIFHSGTLQIVFSNRNIHYRLISKLLSWSNHPHTDLRLQFARSCIILLMFVPRFVLLVSQLAGDWHVVVQFRVTTCRICS